MSKVTVVGAGLAGCEAAWQLAQRGFSVDLLEMKPEKMSPAHKSEDFAELVCSNSLRGDRLENAVGLLKEELRRVGSLILTCAEATRVEAGGCLAVDRQGFSKLVTEKIRSHPNITVIPGEITEIPAEPVIIATGPLTSEPLSQAIGAYFGADYLHFFDAAAPLVTAESVDMDLAWWQSRYDRGTPDYVNCAMDKDQYLSFVRELTAAQEAEVHGFEDANVFEGCMPVEVMARRGVDTLQSGGLPDPPEIRGTEAGLFHDPGPQKCGIRPLRGHAPEYLPLLSQAAGPVLCRPAEPPGGLCRADDRRGGLCGKHRLRVSCRRGHGRKAFRKRTPSVQQKYRHRGAGLLHQRRVYCEFSTHEREFQHYFSAGKAHSQEK